MNSQLNYWLKHLEDIPSQIDLPYDYPRKKKKSVEGSRITFTIPQKLNYMLIKFSVDHNINRKGLPRPKIICNIFKKV